MIARALHDNARGTEKEKETLVFPKGRPSNVEPAPERPKVSADAKEACSIYCISPVVTPYSTYRRMPNRHPRRRPLRRSLPRRPRPPLRRRPPPPRPRSLRTSLPPPRSPPPPRRHQRPRRPLPQRSHLLRRPPAQRVTLRRSVFMRDLHRPGAHDLVQTAAKAAASAKAKAAPKGAAAKPSSKKVQTPCSYIRAIANGYCTMSRPRRR